jgi:hypothetical protein
MRGNGGLGQVRVVDGGKGEEERGLMQLSALVELGSNILPSWLHTMTLQFVNLQTRS